MHEFLKQINSLIFLVLEEKNLDKLEKHFKDIAQDLKRQAHLNPDRSRKRLFMFRSSPKK